MKYIRIIRNPQPDAQEPEFVKKAYAGLCLKPSAIIPPGDREHLPQGMFLVPLSNFMQKMKLHSPEAYAWLSARWGEIDEAVRDTRHEIQFVFPFDCCYECDNETIQ